MGYNSWTTDDLIYDIDLMGHIPEGGASTFPPEKIIRLADLELQTPIMSQILKTRGGYYKTYRDFDRREDGLYVIPGDCIAGTLDNIELIQAPTIVPVNIIEESEQFSTVSPTSTSYGAFMRGNYVQILPIPNIGTVRLWFLKRTSTLIQTTQAAQVTAVNGAVVTVSSVPSTIQVGRYLDALGDQPPFNILASELEVTNIAGTDITLDAPVTDLISGDWLALHDQTPVPQIPVEFRVLLAQRVVCKIYELQGYGSKLKLAQEKLEEYEEATFSLITPRIKSQTKVINPVNGGFLAGRNRYTNFPAGHGS